MDYFHYISGMAFKVRYIDFWPGFLPANFLFTCLLEELVGSNVEIVKDTTTKVDLQFNSVFVFGSIFEKTFMKLQSKLSSSSDIDYQSRVRKFHRLNRDYPATKYVWYTGENRSAPTESFDHTISFDPTDAKFGNLYFPYWMLRIDWGYRKGEFEIMPRVEEMMSTRSPVARPLNACLFSSKFVAGRERISKIVEELIPIEKFGTQFNRPVTSKFTTAQDFGLQLCLENEISPGYVTEKIQEAWASRNVPIWAGLQTYPYFNSDAMIDVTNLNSLEIQNKLKGISPDELLEIQSRPILMAKPSLEPLKELLSKCL